MEYPECLSKFKVFGSSLTKPFTLYVLNQNVKKKTQTNQQQQQQTIKKTPKNQKTNKTSQTFHL